MVIFFLTVNRWAFEVIALAAGILGESNLAAQTIVLNTCSLFFMIPFGFGVAATTRVGNALGANQPISARHTSFTALLLAVILACCNSSILLLIRNQWGYLFSKDVRVIELVSSVLPYSRG